MQMRLILGYPPRVGAGRSVVLATMMLALALFVALTSDGQAQSVEPITFPSGHEGLKLEGYLLKPSQAGRRPAVVALHGCGGPLSRRGGLSKRHLDWGQRLARNGFVVLFPDSFGSRGYRSLCRVRPRPVKQRDRVDDTFAAARWLAAQPYVDSKRIALLGWSNGGITTLRVVTQSEARLFRRAFAFYPGCRGALRRARRDVHSRPVVPLTIHIGAADDWTPPVLCVALTKIWKSKIHLYPGAYHSFDTPGSRVRVRQGMAFTPNGTGVVHVGTNPKARTEAIRRVMDTLRQM
jgi:dienelactone hydrolase